jgi:hypothetical protein
VGMELTETTPYETRIIAERIAAGEVGPVALHRISGVSIPCAPGVTAFNETNDDDDDGYPDGTWERWADHFKSVADFKRHAGVCRVGVSGVIVTVTLDGEEVR